MHKFLYNYFDYRTYELYKISAVLIQKTYRNYKKYQIQKRLNSIKFLKSESKLDKIYDIHINNELDFWKTSRNLIKNKKQLKDYDII